MSSSSNLSHAVAKLNNRKSRALNKSQDFMVSTSGTKDAVNTAASMNLSTGMIWLLTKFCLWFWFKIIHN